MSHDDVSLAPARPPVSGPAAPGQLFVVERRLPKASAQQLALLQSALSGSNCQDLWIKIIRQLLAGRPLSAAR